MIVYRKVQVLRGKWSGELIRHHVVSRDLEPLLESVKPGQTAITFFVENTSHFAGYTYLDGVWYVNRLFIIDSKVIKDMGKWEAYWVRPSQLRTFCGKAEDLATAVTAILKGKEVLVPCRVADKTADLAAGRGRVQKMRASLKRLNYDAKRDAVD